MIVYVKTADANLKNKIKDALKDKVNTLRIYDTSEKFWTKVARKTPTMIIFDIRNASSGQLYNIKRVRSNKLLALRRAPILAISHEISEDRIIKVLNTGADDVLASPFSNEILVARIESIARRAERQTNSIAQKKMQMGDLKINPWKANVYVRDEKISLTATEFDILHYLYQNKNTIVSKTDVALAVWGYDDYQIMQSLNTHILNLRKKLGVARDLVQTVRSKGYMLSRE
jgi:DNA-binding response OmpR family regulator